MDVRNRGNALILRVKKRSVVFLELVTWSKRIPAPRGQFVGQETR